MLFLGFSIKSASWLPFVPVFPEGPPAPAHAHSLAEDWRTLQVGCRAAGRQAGMRADAACKGEGRLLLGGRWRWQGAMLHTVARSSVGRSVGRLQSAKGRARERQRCLIPSLPVAVLPSVLRSLPPPTAATVLSSKWRSRETETELDGPSRKVRGVISGLRDE